MCEIRPEAHIKCKAVSEETVIPGVVSLIREPTAAECRIETGNATMVEDGNYRNITFKCGFVPRVVFLHGYKTESYSVSNAYYNQSITIAFVCDLKELRLNGRLTRYYNYTYSTSSGNRTHSNSGYTANAPIEFTANEDGNITIKIPELGTNLSYVRNDMGLNFYAYE